jgi:hypothetical protein
MNKAKAHLSASALLFLHQLVFDDILDLACNAMRFFADFAPLLGLGDEYDECDQRKDTE